MSEPETADQRFLRVLLRHRVSKARLDADPALQEAEVARGERALDEADDLSEGRLGRDREDREVPRPRLVEQGGRDGAEDHADAEADGRQALVGRLDDERPLGGGVAAQPQPRGEQHPARVEPAGRVRDLDRVGARDRPAQTRRGCRHELEAELRLRDEIAERQRHGANGIPCAGDSLGFTLDLLAFHYCREGARGRKIAPMEAAAKADALRVAVDVGGTFTDVFVFDESGASTRVAKVPSTPHDPMEAVLDGVSAAGVDLDKVSLFSHGTTVATNALITRRFPKVAMVTTAGFRDVIEIRRGTKEDLWDAYKDVAPPYVRRRDRFEVRERVDYSGHVIEPLDEDDARRVAGILRRRDVEAVAVCFINAYANPENEKRMREHPRGGAARRDRDHVERGAAGDLRARALLDHGRERRPLAARRRLRRAASASGWPKAATTATCSSCTRAAA